MSIIGECRNNKECVINKKNRTSCKACRLQKCLQVGMSKSGSRYGRRSNWFKQYFQETEHMPRAGKTSPPSQHDSESEQSYPSPDHLKSSDQLPFLMMTTTTQNSSPGSVTSTDAEDHKKLQLPFDLYAATQPLISSHLYLNCFPTLGLNRLVSCKHTDSATAALMNGENAATAAAAAAFFLPRNLSFSQLLPNGGADQANVNDYFEKLFVARYDRDDDYDRRIPYTIDEDNPLDLSSKRHRSKDEKRFSSHRRRSSQHHESELSNKVLPLDLSVK